MPLNAFVKNVLRHARHIAALRQKVIQRPRRPSVQSPLRKRQLRIKSAHQPAGDRDCPSAPAPPDDILGSEPYVPFLPCCRV